MGDDTAVKTRVKSSRVKTARYPQCTVEVVSDSGEGAQKCGQTFGAVSAKMGNGVWTVEIIPAEIQPPPRSPAGASGNRIRIGEDVVTNWGDRTNVAIAFNEQVLLARHRLNAIEDEAILLVENMWATHKDEDIRAEWAAAMEELEGANYRIIEVPMEEECLAIVDNPRKGKNMFALGILCWMFDRDMEVTRAEIAHAFRKKAAEVTERNHELLELGYSWADSHLDVRIEVKPGLSAENTLVMNGNQAIAYGAVAAGMDLAAMYPITPATSVSHQLGEMFHKFGGVIHQAEDEIAAAGVAIGASYSGKVAFTITSGPGLALKTEFLGLSVMSEIPLVVVDVQRGGPSTGLPTKVEQSDLLAALFGQPGDAPHVVMAPATIEECFHSMVTARRIAETFRTLVIVMTDANLATGVQPFPRPVLDPAWQGSLPDMSPVPEGKPPYDWDEETGLSRRFVPGTPGGMHTLTGLAHDEHSKVAYASAVNQKSSAMRSRKMAVLHSTLRPPVVYGDEAGDLLVVGWGSTKGAIEEAVDRARAEGLTVSSLHLRFLSPLEPGLKAIFGRFKRVMTVEINYSDDPDLPYITEENRRRGQLAWLLRAQTLVDVDCWTRVLGEPLQPGAIHEVIRDHISKGSAS
ncbi:MAG: 2-oxoacid:acceptor oxidoreductase subunit alpha [marine benthic group bacterium]|nr:2-oxoacid:acceptor oxidoreductase subunit alpha [Candidatus Benthicola marisminoris]